MAPQSIRYEAEGWGVGELWLDQDRPVWHELPVPVPVPGPPPNGSHPLAGRLCAYFAGEAVGFADVDLEPEGTHFQQELAAALRRVPRGEVVTYGELAALAGRPGAARAAGTFCAQNRLPVFIPCHRVVSADGVGSYGSLGLEYKLRMLALEGVSL